MLAGRGQAELVHSMVCTGALRIQDAHGSCQEDVVFPPRELSNTASQHLGQALTTNFEKFLFGTTIDSWLEEVAGRYGAINLQACGDSASANLKCVEYFFQYMQQTARRFGVTSTGVFTSCYLHQFGRLLALHIEHRAMSSALYSVTRLQQHSTTRDAIKKSLYRLLQERFVWHQGVNPPAGGLQTETMRAFMLKLFSGFWQGEEGIPGTAEPTRETQRGMKDLLTFFNGDIRDHQSWAHYCPAGCHNSRHEALQEAPRLD